MCTQVPQNLPLNTPKSIQANAIFKGVYNRVTLLSFCWREFKSLFLESRARVNFLNQHAGGFFAIVQEMMIDAVFLHLSVLSDPAKQGQYQNLSFDRLLVEFKKPLQRSGLYTKAEGEVNEFKRFVITIRVHRNKRIAHADVATFKVRTKRLPRVRVDEMTEAVKQAFRTFKAICSPISGEDYAFDEPIIIGDASAVVAQLQNSDTHKRLHLWLYSEDHSGRSGMEIVRQILRDFYGDDV